MAQVHLTFDNGPDPEGTPLVLGTLRRWHAQATFFVLGKHLATPTGRHLALRIRDEGHRLGNHSYSHRIPLGDDPRPEAVQEELERTQRLLDPIYSGPRLFRPFGGGGVLGPHLLSEASAQWLEAGGHTCVLWNAIPEDWIDPHGWVDRAMRSLSVLDHGLIVLHDILPDAMTHLGDFLRRLMEAGHTLTDTFPPDCLPIVEGQRMPGAERYIRGDRARLGA